MDATRTKELRERDDQVDSEDEEVAHGANRTMAARARKTAPYRRIPSYYDFACDTRLCRGVVSTETEGTICVTR